jgi:hypothetical protein
MSIDREVILFYGFKIDRRFIPEEPETDVDIPPLDGLLVDEFKRFNNIIEDYGCEYVTYGNDDLAIGVSKSITNSNFNLSDIIKLDHDILMSSWEVKLKKMCKELGLSCELEFAWYIALYEY